MSYSVMTPCYCCEKQAKCSDGKKIQLAVEEIHRTSFEQGHQGGGSITLTCVRAKSTNA